MILPSSFAASSISWTTSRPWIVARHASERSSIHLTDLPSRRAIGITIMSSAYTSTLEPKPPPTSGAITRTFASGIPSTSVYAVRMMCGACVEVKTVMSPVAGTRRTSTARLDRRRDQPLLAVALLDRDRSVREHLVDLARGERPRVAAVARDLVVDERRSGLERLLDVGHGRERLVARRHELGGVLGLRARLGDARRRRRRRRSGPCRARAASAAAS